MLIFRDVTSGYGPVEILKDISFNVGQGDFFGIIGPNGSGKSTLLRTATKIIPLLKGEVIVKSSPVKGISFNQMARLIAVVPQDAFFFFPFTVMDMVLMGRIPYAKSKFCLQSKDDEKIALEALKSVGAADLRGRFMDELSGGERQRAMIAKALAQKPEILFLDEPTTHLDIGHQMEIFSLIRKLNKETGLTVITILHDLNLASEYCDKLMLLSEGRIKKIGSPAEVLNYKVIEEVYKTCVIVKENPLTSRPHIFVVKK
jgi:iron complex transport system ATP-binding protein